MLIKKKYLKKKRKTDVKVALTVSIHLPLLLDVSSLILSKRVSYPFLYIQCRSSATARAGLVLIFYDADTHRLT